MISAVVLTKNEEKNIELCLQSLSWCDEVTVIDDNSSDETKKLAKKAGAVVFERELKGDFSAQRNYGIEKAKGDWVLFIDADEIVSPHLASEIQRTVNNAKKNGFFIKRIDYMWGMPLLHGEMGKTKLLRLANKNSGKWIGNVHETWEINGEIGELKNAIQHYPHQTIGEFLKKIDFYSTLRAKELYKQGASVNFFSIIEYPKGKFLLNYFFRLGLLDGIRGMVVAIMMSFHSFLVRAKLWQLSKK